MSQKRGSQSAQHEEEKRTPARIAIQREERSGKSEYDHLQHCASLCLLLRFHILSRAGEGDHGYSYRKITWIEQRLEEDSSTSWQLRGTYHVNFLGAPY